jgi:CheY-like chemotaxis protein
MPDHSAVILVVEDEELVRDFVEQVLSEAGYEVLLAATADVAVRILAQREIDLLFTDIVMPGSIDGLGLARLVYAKYPRTRVLCASGYAPALETLPTGDPAFAHLLRKPYRSNTLLDEVAGLLCREERPFVR